MWHIEVEDTTPTYGDIRNPTITLHAIETDGSIEFVDNLCSWLRSLYPNQDYKIKRWQKKETILNYERDWKKDGL